MVIHVNIGEAKTRLSQLIAAAKRGEEVVIAHDGKPTARLVSIDPDEDRKATIARRRAFMGSRKGAVSDTIDWFASDFTEEELDTFERPF